MKPFDLAAAHRGEPVEALFRGIWMPVHFVGINSRQHPVFEGDWNCGEYSVWPMSDVRMAGVSPKVKRTVFVNVYANRLADFDGFNSGAFDTEADAISNAENNHAGLAAIAVPVDIEV